MAKPTFTFDAEKHEYRVGAKVIPSITQILKAEGIIDSTWYNAQARDRGTLVHLLAHLWDKGEFNDLEELNAIEEYAPYYPYMEAYDNFLTEKGVKVICSEEPMWSPEGFAGTPDKVAVVGGRICVIELKTGSKSPWHALQTAAQSYLIRLKFPEYRGCEDRYALYLDPDKYRLENHSNATDFLIWRSIMAVHNWKRGAMK